MGIVVEVVANLVSDCVAIERAGADRIELCAGIVAGGITPSTALYEAARKAVGLPIMVMIRPREGGFFYSDSEFDVMQAELDAFLPFVSGEDGFVFGCLGEDGSIDGKRMTKLRELASGRPVMCHRAFDVTPDPFEAIEVLIDRGVDRVLTSGQTTSILEGLDVIEQLQERAFGRIEVQPCEGIRSTNVGSVLDRLFRSRTSPKAIHFGPFREVLDPTSRLGTRVTYGHHMEVDGDQVRAVVDAVRAFA